MLAINRILVPVDFSEDSAIALAHAAELARTHEAQLVLLHVVESPSFPSFYGTGGMALFGTTPDLEKRARTALNEMARRTMPGGPPVETHVLKGRAGEAILSFAEEQNIDLVVVASQGLTGAVRVALGSVADYVARRSTCPVLVVKGTAKSLVPEQPSVERASE